MLFKITFAQRPDFQNGGLILYADLDCNRQTGRQDQAGCRGTDVMVTIHGTQIDLSYPNVTFNRQNTFVPAAKIVGSVLYVVLDVAAEDRGGQGPS